LKQGRETLPFSNDSPRKELPLPPRGRGKHIVGEEGTVNSSLLRRWPSSAKRFLPPFSCSLLKRIIVVRDEGCSLGCGHNTGRTWSQREGGEVNFPSCRSFGLPCRAKSKRIILLFIPFPPTSWVYGLVCCFGFKLQPGGRIELLVIVNITSSPGGFL